jgi:hypothetical protein
MGVSILVSSWRAKVGAPSITILCARTTPLVCGYSYQTCNFWVHFIAYLAIDEAWRTAHTLQVMYRIESTSVLGVTRGQVSHLYPQRQRRLGFE